MKLHKSLQMKYLLPVFFASLATPGVAQETDSSAMQLPYYQIPDAPEAYTPGAVLSRLIDGLGFRYYWATEGLREQDLEFRPNAGARNSYETLQHIFALCNTIAHTAEGKDVIRQNADLPFDSLRLFTLTSIKRARVALLPLSADDLTKRNIVFQRDDGPAEFPFWNLINGPIADALWHTGQVVSFRRSSGNPFPSGVSLFSGKKR
jgi:hypothetical protein